MSAATVLVSSGTQHRPPGAADRAPCLTLGKVDHSHASSNIRSAALSLRSPAATFSNMRNAAQFREVFRFPSGAFSTTRTRVRLYGCAHDNAATLAA